MGEEDRPEGPEVKMKRLIALALASAMLFTLASCAPEAPAPADPAAEGRYFPAPEHTGVDYADMAYEEYDPAEFLSRAEALLKTMKQPGRFEEILGEYEWMYAEFEKVSTHYELAGIDTYIDPEDQAALALSESLYDALVEMQDSFYNLVYELTGSLLYGGRFRSYAGEDLAAAFSDYQPMDEREKALYKEENALILEYQGMANRSYTYDFEGETWDIERLESEWRRLGEAEYDEIYRGIREAQNQAEGALFLELVRIRDEIAELNGYENYSDYAYELIYGRDYTPEDAGALHEAVRSGGSAALYLNDIRYLDSLWEGLPEGSFPNGEAEIMAALNEYIPRISPELQESLSYMQEHGLCCIATEEAGSVLAGFCTNLYQYQSPFLYNCLYGDQYDILDMVHELGHYNHSYYHLPSMNLLIDGDNLDICEVHSQGLEAVFFQLFSDELFGGAAAAGRNLMLDDLMGGVAWGCIHDEFQQLVYENPGMTLEEVNETYLEVYRRYGEIPYDAAAFSMSWMDVPHNFDSPLYYVSYAVSALTALTIWRTVCQDPEAGVELYLRFSSQGASRVGYLELLELTGLDSFTNAGYVKEVLAEAVRAMYDNDSEYLRSALTGAA